jgi:hypothetical protein
VTPADLDAGRRRGHEHTGDPDVLPLAQEVLRVAQADGQAEQGGDRGEGDIALAPRQPQGQPAVPAAEDDALGGEGGGVRAGLGLGQGEAGDLLTARETREVVAALFVRAVGEEQLRGAHRIGDQHHGRERQRARGELAEDGAQAQGREGVTAVLGRDGEPEEALPLEEVPHRRRQLAPLGHVPGVHHPARLLDRPVEKRPLPGRQLRVGLREHPPEVRPPREQLAVHPNGARLERLALGRGHPGEEAPGFGGAEEEGHRI